MQNAVVLVQTQRWVCGFTLVVTKFTMFMKRCSSPGIWEVCSCAGQAHDLVFRGSSTKQELQSHNGVYKADKQIIWEHLNPTTSAAPNRKQRRRRGAVGVHRSRASGEGASQPKTLATVEGSGRAREAVRRGSSRIGRRGRARGGPRCGEEAPGSVRSGTGAEAIYI